MLHYIMQRQRLEIVGYQGRDYHTGPTISTNCIVGVQRLGGENRGLIGAPANRRAFRFDLQRISQGIRRYDTTAT
jgi:hypothetical protein